MGESAISSLQGSKVESMECSEDYQKRLLEISEVESDED